MERDFEYTYSAAHQEEVRRIRDKYLPAGEPGTLEKLRALDEGVTKKGTVWALMFGILGTLVLGGGMSLCLVWQAYLPGIPLGLGGMAVMGAAYPAYQRIMERERQRIGPEILRLSEELLHS